MSEEIRHIEIKARPHCLSTMRCFAVNGEESPPFRKSLRLGTVQKFNALDVFVKAIAAVGRR